MHRENRHPKCHPWTAAPAGGGSADEKLSERSSPERNGRRPASDGGVTSGSEFVSRLEVFLADVRGKSPENSCGPAFKADQITSKRIRYGFITVQSTTLIRFHCPRKDTTLPAIRSVELDAPTFLSNPYFL
ncbi:hypothetical protein TNCV_4196871 [Trichonephila clavipes]|nr:hypothetical protein TNCV_4196871 [Trichonephila clavipes]